MTPYRAAIIGCGLIGSAIRGDASVGIYTHAGAYTACPHTDLVAVCDQDSERVARSGAHWKVAARYADAARMLADQAPDIVSVCTPDATHYELLKAALETPGVRAVLAEKPLAQTIEQAQELVRLAEANHIVLAVNYGRRFAPSHIAIRDFLLSGGIGTLQNVGGYYTKGLLHNGTHWLDLARFWCGDVAWTEARDALGEDGPDPTLDVTLGFAGGAKGHLAGLDARAFTLFEMDLIGTKGRVRVTEAGHTVEVYGAQDSTRYAGYRELALEDGALSGGLCDVLLHAVEDVVRCLRNNGGPRCSGRDGVAALAIAHAARASAKQDCKMPVETPII